jgi:predicted ATPase/DNA-binding NarL/FixJ family response regulator
MDVAVPNATGGRLPAEVAGFVGRRGELAEVRRLLKVSRLVTLTGPGGVGKTRLAVRAAAAAERSFPDGVRLVELARLRDPLLLAQSVVDVLDIQDRSARPPTVVLGSYLAERRLLLVLDNCEHLAVPAAELVEDLLRAAPGLAVLATSRQPLGVLGEHVFAVPPMRVPAGERPPDARALGRCEAVNLFAQRASAVLPGFAVTDGNAAAVAGLVAALDGIPLAIELAASWLRVLSVEEVLHRLADRFDLLDGRGQDPRPARRRTLRDVMEWSFGLCSPHEQLLWARVSVFSGGFDLAAAETVCSGNGIEPSEVLHLVAGLVDKSVLIRQDTGDGVRYQLLETVREYGHARLTPQDERVRVRRRHLDHFKRLAEQTEARWLTPEQPTWFNRMRVDQANLRAALEFCVTQDGVAATGLELACRPRDYWMVLGSLGEGRQWLTRLLAVAGEAGAVRTRAMGLVAWFAVLQGDLAAALPLLSAHRERAEQTQDEEELAREAEHRAVALVMKTPSREAVKVFEEAVARQRALGLREGIAASLFKLAVTESLVGNARRALVQAREAVSIAESFEEMFLRSYAVFAEAQAVWLTGDRAAADLLLREAIRLKEPFRDRWGLALCVELMFWSATEDGADARAAYLLGVLQGLWESLGTTVLESVPFRVDVHEAYETQVREKLGGRAFRAAVERGARLAPDQVVADVLREESAQAPPEEPGVGLTKRERQVAELLARGRSNKEIAADLVISLRTAENHVEHILAKLGFSSRTQVAVWVSEQSAPPSEALVRSR